MAVLTWPKAAEGRKASNHGNQSDLQHRHTTTCSPHITASGRHKWNQNRHCLDHVLHINSTNLNG